MLFRGCLSTILEFSAFLRIMHLLTEYWPSSLFIISTFIFNCLSRSTPTLKFFCNLVLSVLIYYIIFQVGWFRVVRIIWNKVCLLPLKLENAKMCCSLKYWANLMIHFLQKDIKTPKFNLHTILQFKWPHESISWIHCSIRLKLGSFACCNHFCISCLIRICSIHLPKYLPAPSPPLA